MSRTNNCYLATRQGVESWLQIRTLERLPALVRRGTLGFAMRTFLCDAESIARQGTSASVK